MGTTYEVRVEGVVPVEDLLEFGRVELTWVQDSTVLYGEIRDQAALYGLLARLRALGLEVVEVRQTPDLAPREDEEP
jgi:hypothetical protein